MNDQDKAKAQVDSMSKAENSKRMEWLVDYQAMSSGFCIDCLKHETRNWPEELKMRAFKKAAEFYP